MPVHRMIPTYPALRAWAADRRDDPLITAAARQDARRLCNALDLLDSAVADNARASLQSTVLRLLDSCLSIKEFGGYLVTTLHPPRT